MGWTVAAVNGCSLWELAAALDGWQRCHGADDQRPPTMTPERYDEIIGNMNG